MHYTITTSDDRSYILLKISGNVTRISCMPLVLKSHALGKQLGIHRYLVDMTEAHNVDTVMDQYEFAYTDMQHTDGIDRLAMVAAVVSPDDHSHDFIETVSVNAGLNLKIFTDYDAAVRHLRQHASSDDACD